MSKREGFQLVQVRGCGFGGYYVSEFTRDRFVESYDQGDVVFCKYCESYYADDLHESGLCYGCRGLENES